MESSNQLQLVPPYLNVPPEHFLLTLLRTTPVTWHKQPGLLNTTPAHFIPGRWLSDRPGQQLDSGIHSEANTHVHSTRFPGCSRLCRTQVAAERLFETWRLTAGPAGFAQQGYALWTALAELSPSCSMPAHGCRPSACHVWLVRHDASLLAVDVYDEDAIRKCNLTARC